MIKYKGRIMKRKTTWTEVKKALQTQYNKDGVICLIKELYDLSVKNKDFLNAKFAKNSTTMLEKYKEIVIEPFFPKKGGFGKLKLMPAKKAISDYKKATNDILGTLDLMLTYVESGTDFTVQFGDIDENFYNSLVSVLYQFKKLITLKDLEYFKVRLIKLNDKACNIGWGYGDGVSDVLVDFGII